MIQAPTTDAAGSFCIPQESHEQADTRVPSNPNPRLRYGGAFFVPGGP